jgi:TonB family protein
MQSPCFFLQRSLSVRAIVAVVLVVSASCARKPSTGEPFTFVIERPAHPYADNPAPSYPASLVATRDTGRVVLAFVVTNTGLVDTSTIEVVRSDHPAFEAAARAVLTAWRFYPAEIGGTPPSRCSTNVKGQQVCARRGKPGRPVDQRVEIPFRFQPPPA